MDLHRTSIPSRSLYAIPLLTAVALTKLPGPPAHRLEPQPINRPQRRARRLMPSTLCLASRPTSLPSCPWMIKGGQLRALVPSLSPPILLLPLLPALPILASAQHQRLSLQQALMEGRRRPSRRLTQVRDTSVCLNIVCSRSWLSVIQSWFC
jgi:hypothetical protein